MKKKNIFILVIIILSISGIIILLNQNKKYKERVAELEEKVNILDERTAGMSVTMIGGSNMKENGNVNSCGFIIRTKNEKLCT